jgi:hypothetical protein
MLLRLDFALWASNDLFIISRRVSKPAA